MMQGVSIAETPRDVLELRRKLLNWWRGPVATAFIGSKYPDKSDAFARWLAAHEATVLCDGEMFFISDEMTEVARAAAQTLPEFRLEAEDLPSEMGTILFHHPIAQAVKEDGERCDIIAATWWSGTIPGSDDRGIWFCWYEDRDGGALSPSDPNQDASRAALKTTMPRLLFERYTIARLGCSWEDGVERRVVGMPAVVSALLLMQQPLAARERKEALPLDRRRAVRANISDTSVTVVTLRHQVAPGAESVVRPRDWRHRWIVRGHWRNQWLPSRGTHRPTWINAHIKGPEDLPIKVTEKVHVWAR